MMDVAKASVADRRFALAVALVALAAVVGAVVFGEAGRERVLRYFHVGYQQRVSAFLAEGKTVAAVDALERASLVAALDELERASLIDASRIEMLHRMARLNQAASFASPPTAQLFAQVSGDAVLRFRIGRAMAAELGGVRNLTESERSLLERATEDARMLVALEPSAARSHYLMGTIHLLRGNDTGSSSELSSAVSSLERALSLDPNHPGARRALEEARGKLRTSGSRG